MSSQGSGGDQKEDDLITPRKKRCVDRIGSAGNPLATSKAIGLHITPDSGGRATQQPIPQALDVPIVGAPEIIVLQKLGWKSSTQCKGCRATSTSADPVAVAKDPNVCISLESVRKWQYNFSVGPRGKMCWYCGRVLISVFKPHGVDWAQLCDLVNLKTGNDFCIFVHQLEQAPTAIAFPQSRRVETSVSSALVLVCAISCKGILGGESHEDCSASRPCYQMLLCVLL